MSLNQRLFDLEYGRDMIQSTLAVLGTMADWLHIPPWADVLDAGQAATQDSIRAIQSLSYLMYLIGQPVVRLLSWIVYWIGRLIYKYILVEGIYNQGLSQVKEVAVLYWKWQVNRTKAQLLYEAATIIILYGLYRLYKFIKRRQYHRRLVLWMDRRTRQVQKVRASFFRWSN